MRPADLVNPSNISYLEQLFEQYRADPNSIPEQWRTFFAGFELGLDRSAPPGESTVTGNAIPGIFDLVHSFRELGHHSADLDPLKLQERPEHP
jgi:2-oxoglutarate dehydrogenase E1 component